MAIAVDSTTYYATLDNATSVSVSHTVTGSDTYMLVGLCSGLADASISRSVDFAYNGVSMSSVLDSGLSVDSQARVIVYGLVAPASGAHNLTFTFASATSGRSLVVIRTYTGVHQSTPIGTAASATAESTTPSVNVSSATGELVSDFVMAWAAANTLTVDGSQTERVNQSTTGSQKAGSSDEAGAGTVTMSWSCSVSDDWAIVAVPIKPTASGTTLYFLDSAASGSNFGQLQVGGSAPSTATTATGWTVDTVGATNYALMAYASERLSSVFSGTAQPAGNPDNSLGDCFRSTSTMTGDFATGVWTIAVPVIAVSAAAGQDGRVRVRLWKSANATGTSPTEITSGAVAGTTVTNLTTGAEQVSTVTTGSITGFSMTNEYLFVQIAWEITGAAT